MLICFYKKHWDLLSDFCFLTCAQMCTFVIGMLSIEIIVFFESLKSRLSWSYDKQNIHTPDHFIISLIASS